MKYPALKRQIVSLFQKISKRQLFLTIIVIIALFGLFTTFFLDKSSRSERAAALSQKKNAELAKQLSTLKTDFETLKNTDQIKRNDELEKTIKEVQKNYDSSVLLYEKMADIPPANKDLPAYRKRFAKIIKYLSDKNYASGSAEIASLNSDIDKANAAATALAGGIDLSSVPVNNAPPGSGFSRQQVKVGDATYLVDVVAGNLSSTKVVVDTASDEDCHDNCPTLPLGTYVARNGAYAGINGSYFCPAEYPSCAGKTNSFDTLAMNTKKHYFNSDNNVYSAVPVVVFGGGWVRFIGNSSGWGRDTGVDGVLANQPLLVSGGNSVFGGDGDPKKGSVGNRSFVANKGNTVYIGVVHGVTVAGAALVLQAMGMENALNLDSGGSTALWAGGGYKAGPGRNIPNAILFVNK